MDDQAKRIREALLAERRARITAQQAQRRSEIAEHKAQIAAERAQRREELAQEQLRQAVLIREERLHRQLARAAIKAARKKRLIIIFNKSDNEQE